MYSVGRSNTGTTGASAATVATAASRSGHGGRGALVQRLELLDGRQRGEAAGHDARRVRGASADERAPLVRQPLEAQGPRHHVGVRRDEREDRRRAEQVGGHEEVDVQDVRVEVLGVLEELAELPGLRADLDAQGVLGGLDRGERVADGADAADAARDAGDLGVVAPAHHGLEEARGLGHLPLALLDLAVGHVDDDVAVALDAGQVVDVDTSVVAHDVSLQVDWR